MAERFIDDQCEIGYRDRRGISVWFTWDHEAVGIGVGRDGAPRLTPPEARVIANRIIDWCDEAEGNQ